ncbi:hypothetical protein GCM10023085_32340 [Actinomadura viridis]
MTRECPIGGAAASLVRHEITHSGPRTLTAAFGVGIATARRCVTEVIDLLARRKG